MNMLLNNKRLIVVLGMHRSGTSAVTRGLKVMGVELGENLLPPQADNVTGFWEDVDLNALNIEMLNTLHSDWHFAAPIEQSDIERLHRNGYTQRAVEILQNKMSNVEIFGFKDPRVAKLLQFWKEVFSQSKLKVRYVLVFRHPMSVWKSLEKRHGFDLEKSSLLWLDHIISSLVGTLNESCVLVDYDRLMESPKAELERIAEELQLEIDPQELEKFELEFLDEGLRHTVYRPQDLTAEKSILPIIQEMYSTLRNAAANHIQLQDATLRSQIAQWKNEFLRLVPMLVFIDKLSFQVMTQDVQIHTLIAQVAANDRQVQALTIQVNEMDRQLNEMDRQLNEIMISKAWRIAMLLRRVKAWVTFSGKQN